MRRIARRALQNAIQLAGPHEPEKSSLPPVFQHRRGLPHAQPQLLHIRKIKRLEPSRKHVQNFLKCRHLHPSHHSLLDVELNYTADGAVFSATCLLILSVFALACGLYFRYNEKNFFFEALYDVTGIFYRASEGRARVFRRRGLFVSALCRDQGRRGHPSVLHQDRLPAGI